MRNILCYSITYTVIWFPFPLYWDGLVSIYKYLRLIIDMVEVPVELYENDVALVHNDEELL